MKGHGENGGRGIREVIEEVGLEKL